MGNRPAYSTTIFSTDRVRPLCAPSRPPAGAFARTCPRLPAPPGPPSSRTGAPRLASLQGRTEQAERELADLAKRATDDAQRGRIAIARYDNLAQWTGHDALWILDEPITNLDSAGIALFEECMAEHLRTGGLILTAAHQLLLQGRPGVRTLELY